MKLHTIEVSSSIFVGNISQRHYIMPLRSMYFQLCNQDVEFKSVGTRGLERSHDHSSLRLNQCLHTFRKSSCLLMYQPEPTSTSRPRGLIENAYNTKMVQDIRENNRGDLYKGR